MEVPDVPPIQSVTVDYVGPEIIFCHVDAETKAEVRWAQKQGRRLVEPGENQQTGLIGGGTEAQVYKQKRLQASNNDGLPRYRVVKELRLLSGRNASQEIDKRRKQSINIFAFFSQCTEPGAEYLVKFDSWFEYDGQIYIAMEHVQHGDMTACVQEALPHQQVLRIAWQLFKGLELLHIVSKGPDWHIKLADFGTCKLNLLSVTIDISYSGTRDYMAPEVRDLPDNGELVLKTRFGKMIDMFSAGLVIHELLSGKRPTGETGEKRRRVIENLAWPELPDNLKNDLERLLSWQPKRRPTASYISGILSKWGVDEHQSPRGNSTSDATSRPATVESMVRDEENASQRWGRRWKQTLKRFARGREHGNIGASSEPDLGELNNPPSSNSGGENFAIGIALSHDIKENNRVANLHLTTELPYSGQSEQLPFFKDYYSQDDIHPGDTVSVLWAYQPRAADEFSLERGDMLKIIGLWDDGWATGIMLNERAEEWEVKRGDSSPSASGEIKAIPLVCVCLPQHWRGTIEGESKVEA
ncbi:hypothetical protein CDV31_005770 [Fusarium ambrosium]|uniref:Protein kinase domain-containing protein n=1 Tax=Fusarium ambrosium TaxID=131363 RepID=A0A428UH45_9HYPO|nr:hypothetical protein CDV31_005770 [Fusarium ambrosium]